MLYYAAIVTAQEIPTGTELTYNYGAPAARARARTGTMLCAAAAIRRAGGVSQGRTSNHTLCPSWLKQQASPFGGPSPTGYAHKGFAASDGNSLQCYCGAPSCEGQLLA